MVCRLHLIADATYEMPVAFCVTKESDIEQTETEKLLEEMEKAHKERLKKSEYFLGDKGSDSGRLIRNLEEKGIVPVIDIRNCWKDGDETHQHWDTDLVYNYKGNVWHVEKDGTKTELLYRGYDQGTDSLRYGFKPQKKDKRIFRIKCEEDRRIFTPVARSRHKWKGYTAAGQEWKG